MRIIKLNYAVLLLFFISTGAFAQTKKLSKTYQTSSNVHIEVDSKHTNIIIENWDKDEVSMEAYLEGEVGDKEAAKKLLDSWQLETSNEDGRIKIKSGGGGSNWNIAMNFEGLEKPLASLPQMLEPIMNDLVGPILANIAENPLPPNFAEDMGDMKFDYEAYKKDGDKYMKRWEAKIEKKFGKDFEEKMEKWGEEVEKNSEKWEKEYEAKMEVWGKKFEKDMETWGESFGKDMEAWGEQFGKQMEARFGDGDENVIFMEDMPGSKSKKTIKLKIPKDAKLQLNVRHGELKLGSSNNLKADLSHSRLSANRIAGKQTNIKAAYTPVNISNWDYGVLTTEYVKNCVINKAVSIKLNSNSSDVIIKNLEKTGVLTGSFGKLDIQDLGVTFENLNISLENSDLRLSLPNTAFNFSYNGMQSSVEYPDEMKLKSTKSYDSEMLNGYYKSKEGSGSISIKANYSDVLVN